MRCEERTLDDIRALGGNDAADERRFATAARVSEINLALYRTFAQPLVRAFMSEPAAEWLRKMASAAAAIRAVFRPNPWMAPVGAMAEAVRKNRRPASPDNPLLKLQKTFSDGIVAALDAWRKVSETIAEQLFLTIFGLARLQAAVGIDPAGTRPLRKAGRTPLHRELVETRIAELKSRIADRGRARRRHSRAHLCRPGRARRSTSAVSRPFAGCANSSADAQRPTLAEFKAMVRDQAFLLLLDPEAAVAALPALIPDAESRRWTVAAVREVLSASGERDRRSGRAAAACREPAASRSRRVIRAASVSAAA